MVHAQKKGWAMSLLKGYTKDGWPDNDLLKRTIQHIPQLTQAQYDLEQQLRDLQGAALRLGLRDAHDFIGKILRMS